MPNDSDDKNLYPSFEDWLKSEEYGFSHFIDELALNGDDPYDDDDEQNLAGFEIDDEEVDPSEYADIFFAAMEEIGISFPIIYNGRKADVTFGSQIIFLAALEGITYSENQILNDLFGHILELKPLVGKSFDVIFTHLLFKEYVPAIRLLISFGVDKPFCCQGKDEGCIITHTYQNVKSGITIPDGHAPRDDGTFLSRN